MEVNELILETMDRARSHALMVRHRHHLSIDRDDAVSIGYVALVEAAKNYDPSKSHKFWTFASFRVSIALVDAARAGQGNAPRMNRYTGKARVHIAFSSIQLDQNLDFEHGERSGLEPAPQCLKVACNECPPFSLRRAMRTLRVRDRQVVKLFYREGWSLVEIAAKFGINESRACQVRYRALKALKRELGTDGVLKLSDIL